MEPVIARIIKQFLSNIQKHYTACTREANVPSTFNALASQPDDFNKENINTLSNVLKAQFALFNHSKTWWSLLHKTKTLDDFKNHLNRHRNQHHYPRLSSILLNFCCQKSKSTFEQVNTVNEGIMTLITKLIIPIEYGPMFTLNHAVDINETLKQICTSEPIKTTYDTLQQEYPNKFKPWDIFCVYLGQDILTTEKVKKLFPKLNKKLQLADSDIHELMAQDIKPVQLKALAYNVLNNTRPVVSQAFTAFNPDIMNEIKRIDKIKKQLTTIHRKLQNIQSHLHHIKRTLISPDFSPTPTSTQSNSFRQNGLR